MRRHIVIAGQGRAGTTLFYNMLRHTSRNLEYLDTEASAKGYLHLPDSYCTKRPFDIFQMPQLVAAAKSAGKRLDLIASLRDPRDLVTSKHKSVPDDYFVGADHCYFAPVGRKPEFTAPGIIPIHNAIVQTVNSGLFPQGVFLLKYENLVADPAGVQRLLAENLDMEFEGSFSDFHKAAIPEGLSRALNGVRPVEVNRVQKWRKPEHRARVIDQFTRFPDLHKIVVGLGYEKDESWFDDFKASAPA